MKKSKTIKEALNTEELNDQLKKIADHLRSQKGEELTGFFTIFFSDQGSFTCQGLGDLSNENIVMALERIKLDILMGKYSATC